MNIQHRSVMLAEVLQYLKPERDDGLFIDCTLGEGGHSAELLKLFPRLCLVGIDADKQIMARAMIRLADFAHRTSFFHLYFDEFFQDYPVKDAAHRVLLDLGISRFHYTESGRGFSFLRDEKLDMRINPERGRPLAELLRSITQMDLQRLLFTFGEEPYAKRIAAGIIKARREAPITSSLQLAGIISAAVPRKRRKIHAATKSFQALRIFVNAELDRLRPALFSAFDHLEIGGRMGVISFHSLEDRIVKHVFRDLSKSCICPRELPMCECGGKPLALLPLRKAAKATEAEVNRNPPSRSARFRVLEKVRETRHDA